MVLILPTMNIQSQLSYVNVVMPTIQVHKTNVYSKDIILSSRPCTINFEIIICHQICGYVCVHMIF
jgi:hypothetical protein